MGASSVSHHLSYLPESTRARALNNADGGKEEVRWVERFALRTLAGLSLVVLLALVGLVFLVWLIVT